MKYPVLGLAAGLLVIGAGRAHAQGVTLPPSGDNQKASVSQWIGLVKVDIDYSSPDVTGPDGSDRTGHIYGEVVPYGLVNLGFGTCGDKCPWRAGANENTVFRVSHDVKIEGKKLPAGAYGLHMIPGEKRWTIIFSKNSTSWGSFFYDAKEDALRVSVEARPHAYTHWLTYEFIDRQPAKATVALRWENLEVPMTISVDNLTELYVANLRNELRSAPGFDHQAWRNAAEYCLTNKTNLKEALIWAKTAVDGPYVGQESFETLKTWSALLAANGKKDEADKVIARALAHPTATPIQIHTYGRELLARGEKEAAVAVFEANAKKHPDTWPVNLGLARGYSTVGRMQDALRHAELALKNAPDEPNRKNIEKMIEGLKAGKPAP
ncbi:MAG: DUF2911 domain-containing protein [Myxococcales bacterium]|nr:DUF2911 domain-containing protein [Myxococcales bacterium]